MVAFIIGQTTRAHDAAVGLIGIGGDRRRDARQHSAHVRRDQLLVRCGQSFVEVDVRPGPQFSGGRQRLEIVHADVWQGSARHVLAFVELGLGEDDEREPRTQLQAARVGRGRRVTPWQILVIEFNRREEVRLEIRDPRPGVRAQDRPRVDADDISRPIERDVLVDLLRQRAAVEFLAGELHADLD